MQRLAFTRRRFLLAASSSIMAASQAVPRAQSATDVSVQASSPAPGLAAFTPTAEFFRQPLRPAPPLDTAHWQIYVTGQVSQNLTLNYAELLHMPVMELPCTLACIGSSAQTPWIGNALWRGVALANVLEAAGADPAARYIQFHAADGYSTSVEVRQTAHALLAYEMNGAALRQEHGFPARVIVPGLYGYKMPKWITGITLTDRATPGFWESRGWSAVGEVQTTSAIISPRHRQPVQSPVVLVGIAYAGARPIIQVEISVDDGPWMPAPVQRVADFSWYQWQIEWMPSAPGDYLIRVRATDESGFMQGDGTPTFPHGSSAIQAIVVRVTS